MGWAALAWTVVGGVATWLATRKKKPAEQQAAAPAPAEPEVSEPEPPPPPPSVTQRRPRRPAPAPRVRFVNGNALQLGAFRSSVAVLVRRPPPVRTTSAPIIGG